jgi:hypothetical protein
VLEDSATKKKGIGKEEASVFLFLSVITWMIY